MARGIASNITGRSQHKASVRRRIPSQCIPIEHAVMCGCACRRLPSYALRTPMRHVQSGGHARLSNCIEEVTRWPDDMGRFPALPGRRVSVVAACARACPRMPCSRLRTPIRHVQSGGHLQLSLVWRARRSASALGVRGDQRQRSAGAAISVSARRARRSALRVRGAHL